ncbi:hypothetical protein Tco_1094187 [Tanacetum coccineum]|uniref:Reverse transcriptase domain-containing protein n=1 Tax=Tanacetum coccineum TaxID=301880 RepID=A0ABQ5IG53_9ASTR
MSSPNRSTSDIEDTFSSMNILNYTLASAGSNSFNSSENAKDNIIPPVFSSFYNNPCLKDVQAFYAKELPISSPDPITPPVILTPSPVLPPSLTFRSSIFLFPKETINHLRSKSILHLLPQLLKMHLKHHEEQIEDILNYLDELSFHRIEKMEERRINGNELKTKLKEIRTQIIKLQKKRMPPKRTSTSETPAITLDAIRQLIADLTTAVEATDCSHIFSRSRCAEENKVTFATGTLTNDALSWWNAHAQPIGIEQANQITWTELKMLLTNNSKMEGKKSLRLMEIVDIMDLIPFVGSVLYITQDRALLSVRIATK